MAARILVLKNQLEKSLHDRTKPWAGVLDDVETKTGINRLYLFVGKSQH